MILTLRRLLVHTERVVLFNKNVDGGARLLEGAGTWSRVALRGWDSISGILVQKYDLQGSGISAVRGKLGLRTTG